MFKYIIVVSGLLMGGATAFALNSDPVSHLSGSYSPLSSITVVHASQAKAQDAEAQSQIDEEFIIRDQLAKELQGTLSEAFRAYNEGKFELAEKKFSKLALRQRRTALAQRLAQQNVGIDNGRTALFDPDNIDETYTPKSAPRAKALAFGIHTPLAEVELVSSKLYYLQGVTQIQQNKNEEAIQSFRDALRAYKGNIEARIEYTLVSLKLGDLETATKHIQVLDKAVAERCGQYKCIFSSESKARYAQVRLAYENMLGDNKG